MFVTFITIFFFSNGSSNLTTIEILVLLSWIPASKEFISSKHLFSSFSKNIAFTNFLRKKVWERISAISTLCSACVKKIHKFYFHLEFFPWNWFLNFFFWDFQSFCIFWRVVWKHQFQFSRWKLFGIESFQDNLPTYLRFNVKERIVKRMTLQ